MRTEFDLGKVSEHLNRNQKVAKGHIRQIIGAFAIKIDLDDCKRTLEVFWKWHVQQVGPNRSAMGDIGAEGVIGRSLFTNAALRLARALDMGANGRARVDIRPAIRASGLESALNEVLQFRDEELAHYGGYTHSKGVFSDDRAVLVVDDINGSFITAAWRRWNSERTLALKMNSVLDCSIAFIDEYSSKKRSALLSLLRDDHELRDELLSGRPKNLFFPEQFFTTDGPPPTVSPSGPVMNLNWS